jgi:metal-responsive CopG/Arc/MetJ family transcriptional regulator
VKCRGVAYDECANNDALERSILSTVRVNITLPEELARELDILVGPKKKSRFIAEAVTKRIEDLHREHMEELLEEGYKAVRSENLTLVKEFESVDIEGWDEY